MNNSDSPPAHNVQNDIRLLAKLVSDLTTNMNEQLRNFNKRILALEERLDILEDVKE